MGLFSSIGKIIGGGASVIGAVTGNPALSAIGSLAGGLAQNADAKQAAQDQMDFQQYNSNTAYQRAVADMKAAGINPMFALTAGGASTPSGATWTPSDALTPAINSGSSVRRLNNDLQVAQAGIANTQANTSLQKAQTLASIEDAKLKQATAKSVAVDTALNANKLDRSGILSDLYGDAHKVVDYLRGNIKRNLSDSYEILNRNFGPPHSAKSIPTIEVHPRY